MTRVILCFRCVPSPYTPPSIPFHPTTRLRELTPRVRSHPTQERHIEARAVLKPEECGVDPDTSREGDLAGQHLWWKSEFGGCRWSVMVAIVCGIDGGRERKQSHQSTTTNTIPHTHQDIPAQVDAVERRDELKVPEEASPELEGPPCHEDEATVDAERVEGEALLEDERRFLL